MVHQHTAARIGRGVGFAVLAIAASAASARAQSWGQYGVTVYTPQQQFFQSFLGVNNSGQVVGNLPGGIPSIFTPGSGFTTLAGGSATTAYAVNNLGQAAGYTQSVNGLTAAVLSTNSVQTTGTLGGTVSVAYSINDLGQLTGYSTPNGNTSSHAFLWSPSGMIDLGTLGGTNSWGYSVNNSGQVAGSAQTTANQQQHAALWTNGSVQDLGTLGGSYAAALAVNASGQVVGQSNITNNTATHGFLWSANALSDLGTLGGNFSYANGLSDGGVVVGQASNANNVFLAALWESNNGVYQAFDLNSIVNDGVTNSGWSITEARGISADGQWVSAIAQNTQTGYYGTVVLQANAAPTPPVTATPEPASMSLMATGLFGLAGWARRKKKTKTV